MPIQEQATFAEVLAQEDDPTLVRDLLAAIVPLSLQVKVVRAFNQEVRRRGQDPEARIRLDPCPHCGTSCDAFEHLRRTDDPATDRWSLICTACEYTLTDEEQRTVILKALAEARRGHPG